MKLRRLLLAAVLAVSPIAALAQQVQTGVSPSPPVGASPPYAPLGGCVYMPNGVSLTGYVGPMGLTCGANGGLNVNVLTGGGGGGGGSSGGGGAVYGPVPQGAASQPTNFPPIWTGYADSTGKIQGVSPGTPFPISVTNFPATQPVSGTVAISNFPVTQPVSGTVTANQGGAPWSTTISGTLPPFNTTPTFNIGTAPTLTVQGTVTANLGTIAGVATAANQTSEQSASGTAASTFVGIQGTGNANALPVLVGSSTLATVANQNSMISLLQSISASSSTTASAVNTPVSLTANGSTVSTSAPLPVTGTVTSTSTTAGSATGGTAAANSDLGGGLYNSTPPTLTTGQQAAFQLNSSGGLITDISKNLNTNGQKTSANSSPVVIASDQTSIPVLATQAGTWNLTNITGTISLPTGAATAANQSAMQGSATGGTAATVSQLGGLIYNSTLPTLTTGQQAGLQSDVNGRLLANITSSLNSNGQKTSANSSPVVIASDQSPLSSNLYVGGAVNAAGNPIFAQLTTGSATIGAISNTSFGATQSGMWNLNNITGTVSLPTGAATAANQTSPQGSATGGTAATVSVLSGGIYNSTAPTLTTGQQAGLQLNASGALKSDISANLNSNGAKASASSSPVVIATDQSFQRTLQYTEFNASATAASTTYNGTIRTPGTNYTKIKTVFFSTQAGTANVQGCLDAACATAFTQATAAVSASTVTLVPVDVAFPYYRVQFVNGTTAGTLTIQDALNAS